MKIIFTSIMLVIICVSGVLADDNEAFKKATCELFKDSADISLILDNDSKMIRNSYNKETQTKMCYGMDKILIPKIGQQIVEDETLAKYGIKQRPSYTTTCFKFAKWVNGASSLQMQQLFAKMMNSYSELYTKQPISPGAMIGKTFQAGFTQEGENMKVGFMQLLRVIYMQNKEGVTTSPAHDVLASIIAGNQYVTNDELSSMNGLLNDVRGACGIPPIMAQK